ncbi:MAG: peptide-methionine (S)-S-oxide reductase [Alphaproteobacteria bacterium]|nr:peptide-methionine (S)-S-oxide reductase [Alphaproteobacteria bacterium]
MTQQPKGYPIATLAGGCFWCTESEYRALDGVLYTRVGYMGGKTKSPTYQQISTGTTGHAEIVEVTYDPEKIPYADLLRFFLTKAHNPTQLNRQGVDVGTQYRSAIFYHNAAQKEAAMQAIKDAEASGQYNAPIVTAIEPASTFWPAEDYHQQYYEKYEEQNGRKHLRVILKKQGKLK